MGSAHAISQRDPISGVVPRTTATTNAEIRTLAIASVYIAPSGSTPSRLSGFRTGSKPDNVRPADRQLDRLRSEQQHASRRRSHDAWSVRECSAGEQDAEFQTDGSAAGRWAELLSPHLTDGKTGANGSRPIWQPH